jgi:phosphate transport system permease protein
MVWLTGGALALALAMIAFLLALVAWHGLGTFWPGAVVRIETGVGRVVAGEVAVTESYAPEAGASGEPAERATRWMIRSGNYDLTGTHFTWVSEREVARRTEPEWLCVVERLAWGRLYGTPKSIRIDGVEHASSPEDVWRRFEAHHGGARERWRAAAALERDEIGALNAALERARLDVRAAELRHGAASAEAQAARARAAEVERDSATELARVQRRIDELRAANARSSIAFETAGGEEVRLALEQVVRAYPANRLSAPDRFAIYLSRAREFLLDEPRESNSEGGVFPALFGTVLMTLLMCVLVVPFGVLAALYLREYARPGLVVGSVRIAINNLAGVPSIVFGVFGLGFFCYIAGASIDELFYAERLPTPTYGKGGLLWASLTLALLTLPVVIVPTEEALSAVPRSMREGSFACGATKWQTIRRIVLPRAAPGIMTGMILALARGAGEVAPLMLVGAVKLAPELPLDLGDWSGTLGPLATGPLHAERSFMHLGFHIYDLGFQSQNSEAAKPMVYTTTLLLIAIVVLLNLLAITVRARLRQKFRGSHV